MTKVKVAIIKILQETNVKTCLKHGKIKVLGKKKNRKCKDGPNENFRIEK